MNIKEQATSAVNAIIAMYPVGAVDSFTLDTLAECQAVLKRIPTAHIVRSPARGGCYFNIKVSPYLTWCVSPTGVHAYLSRYYTLNQLRMALDTLASSDECDGDMNAAEYVYRLIETHGHGVKIHAPSWIAEYI
jgi:hypothetical protein